MRLAIALTLTTLAAPSAAFAALPYKDKDLSPTPVIDKSLIAHQRANHARRTVPRTGRQPAAIPGYLAAIAACESGGNPSAISGGGQYRGAFQMTYAAWTSVGGRGDPAAAPMSEQVRRAAALYAQAGPSQWPVCGQ